MTFSNRTRLGAHDSPAVNALTAAVAEARRNPSHDAGRFVDLTISNPTTAGFPLDASTILSSLADPRALVYEPAPLGLPSARKVVADHYSTSGIDVSPSQIAITASTSEAYAILFKLLCDPGDEILVPTPSYPLLAWIAAFEAITLRPYPLEYIGDWHVDLGALARATSPRTRGIVVVNPNNPTGSYLGTAELDAMLELGVPIIGDEVFASYLLGDAFPPHRAASVLRARKGLVFALSGLSKLAGLPQLKLGWIVCGGDAPRVEEAMERLETVLDAYLSVGAPVQHALGELLRAGTTTSTAIRARTRRNLTAVRELAARAPTMSVLPVEAGWYATLRVPETMTDEQWALTLALEDRVYVHPGYFFDMTRGAHLVVSLLTPEDELREGMDRITARVNSAA